MFYACLSVFLMLALLIFCLIIAASDIETRFQVALLSIVATMLSCALCIANPNMCSNPKWWNYLCMELQERYPVPMTTTDGASSPKMTGLRSRMMAMQVTNSAHPSSSNPNDKFPLRLMHGVWKGMAWAMDGIDEEEEDATRSYDVVEQGVSTSETSEPLTLKRLSTVVEQEQLISHPAGEEQPGDADGEDVYCNPTTSNGPRAVELALPTREQPRDMRFSTMSDRSYYGLPQSANENQSRHFLRNPYLRANIRVIIASILLSVGGSLLILFSLFVAVWPNDLDVHWWIVLVVGLLFAVPGFYHIFFILGLLCGRSPEDLPATFSRPLR
ncbi:hypothetical protein M3Y99_01156200 [Aphelenchoides fujianensis]|nr:hypothetical protein M3Y99_01156200 [Aphelenchoides fujianensis]